MKKITILFSILIASIGAFAQATTTSQITLSSASQGDKVLQIVVASQFSNAVDYSYDAVVGAGQAGGLYIVYNSDHYTKYATNNLGENLPLGFGAVEDSEYTFNFSYFTGTSFTIYDKKLDKMITVADNILVNGVAADPANKYTFTIEDEEKNTAINDRFVINYVAPAPTGYTVSPNEQGYATFSAAEATVIPSGVTAVYRGVISGDELQLSAITGFVPANTGVIVAGVAGTPYNFAIYNGSVAAIDDNDLKATSTYNTSMQNVYVLKGEAFLEYIGTTALKANKAFIQLPAQSGASAPSRIRMVVNHATGVENAAVEVKAEKFVENGQVLIKRGEIIYNVQGQIVK